MTQAGAGPKQVRAEKKRRLELDQVRLMLALIAALAGGIYGFWKAGLVGAVLTGLVAGAVVIASFTLFHVGISVIVVLLAFVLLFLLYALVYNALH